MQRAGQPAPEPAARLHEKYGPKTKGASEDQGEGSPQPQDPSGEILPADQDIDKLVDEVYDFSGLRLREDEAATGTIESDGYTVSVHVYKKKVGEQAQTLGEGKRQRSQQRSQQRADGAGPSNPEQSCQGNEPNPPKKSGSRKKPTVFTQRYEPGTNSFFLTFPSSPPFPSKVHTCAPFSCTGLMLCALLPISILFAVTWTSTL